MIDVIIPARNEEETIGDIVHVFACHPDIREIIVAVDAETTDDTVNMAVGNGGFAIFNHYHNPKCYELRGKGQLITAALQYVQTYQVILCDADLTGLTQEHISALVSPEDRHVIGVPDFPLPEVLASPAVQKRNGWFQKIMTTWDMVSGERCVPANILRSIDLHGYLTETQINQACEVRGIRREYRRLTGLYSPFVMSEKRLEEMERDRKWGVEHGVLSLTERNACKCRLAC